MLPDNPVDQWLYSLYSIYSIRWTMTAEIKGLRDVDHTFKIPYNNHEPALIYITNI